MEIDSQLTNQWYSPRIKFYDVRKQQTNAQVQPSSINFRMKGYALIEDDFTSGTLLCTRLNNQGMTFSGKLHYTTLLRKKNTMPVSFLPFQCWAPPLH